MSDAKFQMFDLQRFADTTVPVALTQKAWGKQLFEAVISEIYLSTLMGTSSDSVIQKLENLKKEAGDQIIVPLRLKLKGDGVMDDADVEGNEEEMIFDDYTVQVHEYAHGVRLKGNLEEQKTQIKLRQAAKDSLKDWATEKIDKLLINALTASPTTNRLVYAGGKTATNLLTDSDKMATDLISLAKRKAKLAYPKIRQVKVKGKLYYIMLMHDWQFRDLKTDEKWLNAQKDANIRGDENPIFSGMEGIWDGVVIKAWENVHVKAEGASSANVGKALLLGAQAGVLGVAQETAWREKSFNYGKRAGFETDFIVGAGKPHFTVETADTDFGVLQVQTGAKAD